MIMGNNEEAVYDNGFNDTGVTRCGGGLAGPPSDGVGIGATIGPLNLPLSMSRFFQMPDNCDQGSITATSAIVTARLPPQCTPGASALR